MLVGNVFTCQTLSLSHAHARTHSRTHAHTHTHTHIQNSNTFLFVPHLSHSYVTGCCFYFYLPEKPARLSSLSLTPHPNPNTHTHAHMHTHIKQQQFSVCSTPVPPTVLLGVVSICTYQEDQASQAGQTLPLVLAVPATLPCPAVPGHLSVLADLATSP